MTLETLQAFRGTGKVKPSYGYYRQPDGWITVSPAAEFDELHYRRRGWVPLTQYGRFEMSTPYAADHPLEALLILGGAKELSREQIIESGLHLNPPLIPNCGTPLNQNHSRHGGACMNGARPIVFPQIREEDMVSYPCRLCDHPAFPTERGRDQHESVMHKDEKSDLRTGNALAEAIVKGFGGAPAPQAHADPLAVLQGVGLSKRQIEALAAAGVQLPEEASDGD